MRSCPGWGGHLVHVPASGVGQRLFECVPCFSKDKLFYPPGAYFKAQYKLEACRQVIFSCRVIAIVGLEGLGSNSSSVGIMTACVALRHHQNVLS